MIVRTTAGQLSMRQLFNRPDHAWVSGPPEALQALQDGIEMSGGGSVQDASIGTPLGGMIVTKEQLAIWIQFEILNYLTYTELPDELDPAATD